MDTELKAIIAFLKRLHILKQAKRWEREARRAARNGEYCRADMANARARELAQMV